MQQAEEVSKSKSSFQPLPKTSLPPVIHTKYIPHKPRKQPSEQPLALEPSHVSRQHSYNTEDYEMHRRARVERRANSQILSESPISPQFLHSLRAGSLSTHLQTPRAGDMQAQQQQQQSSSLTSHRLASANGSDIHIPTSPLQSQPSTPARTRQGFGQMMQRLAESSPNQTVDGRAATSSGFNGIQSQPMPTVTTSNTPPYQGHGVPSRYQHMSILDTPSESESNLTAAAAAAKKSSEGDSDDSFVLIDTDETDPAYHRELDRRNNSIAATNTPYGGANGTYHAPDNPLAAAMLNGGPVPDHHSHHYHQPPGGAHGADNSQYLMSILNSPTEKPFHYDNKKPPIGSLHPELLCCNSVYTSKGMNLNYVEDGHDACLMNIEIIRYMKQGAIAIKHGRYGRPHSTKIRLAENARSFNWSGKKITNSDKVVRFTWVTKIVHGQTSKVFERYPDERVAPLSFTVYYKRPNRYSHEVDSDDDDPFTADSVAWQAVRPPIPGMNKSTWKSGYEDTSLDIILEDPNDFLIWFQGLRLLTNMAQNKLAVYDESLRLNRNSQSVLLLPILTGYPSSHFIHDHMTGLDVQEQFENEQFHENVQVNAQVALTRKDTVKSIRNTVKSIRRHASSQNPFSIPNSTGISTTAAQDDDVGGTGTSREPSSQHRDASFSSSLNAKALGSTPTPPPGSSLLVDNPHMRQSSTTIAPPIAAAAGTAHSSSSHTPSLNQYGGGGGGGYGDDAASVSTQVSELELALAYPTPWTSITVQGRSSIMDTSWIQQLVYLGPKAGHIYPWVRAYSLDTSASRLDRMLEKIQLTQREVLLTPTEDRKPFSMGGGGDGGMPSTPPPSSMTLSGGGMGSGSKYSSASVNPRAVTTTPRAHSVSSAYGYGLSSSSAYQQQSSSYGGNTGGLDDDDVNMYKNTGAQRTKAYQSFLSRAGGLHLIIMRATDGTIFGGYATAMWPAQPGFFGTPDCFVFRVLDEDVNMSYSDDDISASYNDDKVHQLHIYKWSGDAQARYFQFMAMDAFGFGSGTSKPKDRHGGGGSAAAPATPSSTGSFPMAAGYHPSSASSSGQQQQAIIPSHPTPSTPTRSSSTADAMSPAAAHKLAALTSHTASYPFPDAPGAVGNGRPASSSAATNGFGRQHQHHQQTVSLPPPVLDYQHSDASHASSTTAVVVQPVLSSHPSAVSSPLHRATPPNNLTQEGYIDEHDAGDPHSKENGPAFSLDKDLRVGFSYSCPVYHSPRLSSTRIFECLMLEVWVPVPQ